MPSLAQIVEDDAENAFEDALLDFGDLAGDFHRGFCVASEQHLEDGEDERGVHFEDGTAFERLHPERHETSGGGEAVGELHKRKLLHGDEIGHDVGAEVGREAGGHGAGEVLVKDVDGAELVLSDAIRAAEVVGLGAERPIFGTFTLAHVAEGGIDLFLGQKAFGGQKRSPEG